jgi:hypothetical protein
MKRYIYILLIALIAQCGLSNVVYAINIAPTTLGDDAIVNSIKQYSDLTEADVNQYKLLWLGQLGTYGSFIAGAVSTIGAGVGSYQKSGIVQNITPESVPSWVTNPVVLAGLGSLGAGYVSYKTLYPRMKAGVLDKVQGFIDVCETIKNDTPGYLNDKKKFTVVDHAFKDKQLTFNRPCDDFNLLKDFYLPRSWASASDIAVYNVLSNLKQQGDVAQALLAQIGVNDSEINQRHVEIGNYIICLSHNKQLYEWCSLAVQQKKNEKQYKEEQERRNRQEQLKEQRDIAEITDLKARADLQQQGANLAKVKATETYVNMLTDTVKNVWDGLNYLYKNKEKIVYRGTILGGAMYGAYLTAKAKLGYGQQ